MDRPTAELLGLSWFSNVFPFSFYAKIDLCLILCRKIYADPKIVRIFVGSVQ